MEQNKGFAHTCWMQAARTKVPSERDSMSLSGSLIGLPADHVIAGIAMIVVGAMTIMFVRQKAISRTTRLVALVLGDSCEILIVCLVWILPRL